MLSVYLVGIQHSCEMEIPDCESPASVQHHLDTCLSASYIPVSATDVQCVESGQTVSADDPLSVTFHRTDLDNLPCWIGCIQLDHPYDSHTFSSGSGTFQSQAQPTVDSIDCYHDVSESTDASDVISCNRNADVQCQNSLSNVRTCWAGLSDHAYESSSWGSDSTGDHGHWDHAYNIQCSAEESSSSIGRSVSVQHLDHSYDTRMSSELSHSETVLSSFLDHAYFSSDWTATAGRRHTSGQRWSSSDDLRTVGRAMPAFVW